MWNPTALPGGMRGLLRAAGLLLIALTALGAALSINAIAAFWLEPDPVPPPDGRTAAADSRRAPPSSAPPGHKIILQRDLFDTGTGSGNGRDSDVVKAARDLDILLRGTAAVGVDSYGLFQDAGTGDQGIFRPGERIFDGPKLVSIGDEEATVSINGKRRKIMLFREDKDGPPSKASPRQPAKSGDETSAGIRRVAAGDYVVDRREIDGAIANLNTVITQVRAVPVLKNGKSQGFRVFNIKSGSIFERMGLRNGDVVQRINGVALTDPSKAMGLLDELQSVDQVALDFLRGAKPNSHKYRMQ